MGCTVTDLSNNTVFNAANDNNAAQTSSTANSHIAQSYSLAGLVPGRSYKAVLQFRSSVTTSTAYFDNFRVTVVPSIGA